MYLYHFAYPKSISNEGKTADNNFRTYNDYREVIGVSLLADRIMKGTKEDHA